MDWLSNFTDEEKEIIRQCVKQSDQSIISKENIIAAMVSILDNAQSIINGTDEKSSFPE